MRRRLPKRKPAPMPRPETGKIYRITSYHTGDFVGTCIEQHFQTARYRVNAPLTSELHSGDEIEIAYRSPAHIVGVSV